MTMDDFLKQVSVLRRMRATRNSELNEVQVLDFQSCWGICQKDSLGWQPSQNTNRIVDFGLQGTFEVQDFLEGFRAQGVPRVFVYLDPVSQVDLARAELRKNGLKKGVDIQVLTRSLAAPIGFQNQNFEVSKASLQNWGEIHEILSFGGTQEPLWNEITRSSLDSDFASVFIARKNGIPAALGVVNFDGAVSYLSNGLTRPEFRNQGAQKELIMARLEHARELGCQFAYVETYSFFAPSYDNLLKCGFQDSFAREIFRFEFDSRIQDQLEDTCYGHNEPVLD